MDKVYCPHCGEEHNRHVPHECDPRILATIDIEARDDAEVRRKGDDKEKR